MNKEIQPAEAMVNESVAVLLMMGMPAISSPYPTTTPKIPKPINVFKRSFGEVDR